MIKYNTNPIPIRISGIFYVVCLMIMNLVGNMLKYFGKFNDLLCIVDQKQFSPVTWVAIIYSGAYLCFETNCKSSIMENELLFVKYI